MLKIRMNKYMINARPQTPIKPLTVTGLNQAAKNLLETNFPYVWIEGEISNLSQPASGHVYFSLKDTNAQIPCAFFRQYRQNKTPIENGQSVLVKAKLSLYTQRGTYQLIIYDVQDAGTGALEQAFRALKLRLEKEGLFAEEHKKQLPLYPQKIGIITSATGAALQDMLSVLGRRYPVAEIEVYDAIVQGEKAPGSLLNALKLAQTRQTCDVLIIGRGGGSLEDLWAFNDETLAREIFACEIPIVSGVGHEVDFTITDLVADLRAPTPSAAAESISADKFELQQQLDATLKQLQLVLLNRLNETQNRLLILSKGLTHPSDKINAIETKLKNLLSDARLSLQKILFDLDGKVSTLHLNLMNHVTRNHEQQCKRVENAEQKLTHYIQTQYQERASLLKQFAIQLHTLSPLATLDRGYTITKDISGKPITQSSKLNSNDRITIQWADGEQTAIID